MTDGDHLPPPKTAEGIPFLVIGNVRWNSIDFTNCRFVSPDYYKALDDIRRPKKGDILYTLVGSFGIPVIVNDDRPFCIQRHIGILRPLSAVNHQYLARALASPFVFAQAEGCATGIAQKTVPLSGLREIRIPLPPVAEQQRIVEKVDELMGLCDQLEAAQTERESRRDRLVRASLTRLNQPDDDAARFRDHARFALDHLPRLTTRPEQIAQLRQTILNLAVRGKLVPQDPNDEPAAELLKRIEADREKGVRSGAVRRFQLPPPTNDDELPSLSSGWAWTRLGNLLLCDSQNGYSKKPDEAADGIPILRISAGTVRKDGLVAEEEHKRIGGVPLPQQQQFSLERGDLLACRFNGNRKFVGRLTLYTGYLGLNPIYPDKLIRLRVMPGLVLSEMVRYFADSDLVRRDVEGYSATTVGNWGISASNLKEVIIPLPPLAEQRRIVAKVDDLMAVCDRLESHLTTAQADRGRLLDAVLHAALHAG